MWEDPIVAEVHRIREQLAAKHNFDVKAIFADLCKRQEAAGPRLVRLKKNVESTSEADRMHDSDAAGSSPSQATSAN